MSTPKPPVARHRYPGEGNPPALRPVFRVDGHGVEPVYVEEDGGYVTVRQGGQRVRLPMGLQPALAAAVDQIRDRTTSDVRVYSMRWK